MYLFLYLQDDATTDFVLKIRLYGTIYSISCLTAYKNFDLASSFFDSLLLGEIGGDSNQFSIKIEMMCCIADKKTY